MTMTSERVMQAVAPIPAGFSTITPSLVVDDAPAAIAFYERAFGAVEIDRAPGTDGKIMHATIQIGDSRLMLNDEFPDWQIFGPKKFGGSPQSIHLYVADADAMWERAVAAGATPRMPVADTFWGDRYGQLVDPYGHVWSIATHQRDVTDEEIQQAMQAMAEQGGCGAPATE